MLGRKGRSHYKLKENSNLELHDAYATSAYHLVEACS